MRFKFSENILKASLTVSILLLLIIASENYRQFQSYNKSQRKIINSHKIKTSSQKLLNCIYAAEHLFDKYTYTNDTVYLDQFKNSEATINLQVNQLRKLTANDSIQLSLLNTIQTYIYERAIQLKTSQNFTKSKIVSAGKNSIASQDLFFYNVSSAIEALNKRESGLLRENEEIANKKYKINPLLLLLTVVFSLSIFIVSFIMLYSYLGKMRRNIEKLRINNMIYEQSEKIAHTGHWYFQPGTNNIIFSNNLYRMLGFEPNSFKPNLKKYLGIISESDRPKLINELKNLKQTRRLKPIDIEIIDASGQEKCLRFVAEVVKDEFGNDIVIGANKDLTNEIATNRKLSKLNDELILQREISRIAESIALIGCYTFDFEKQECEFSSNLYRILGHEPNSIEASRENLINFVHNNDKLEFIKSTAPENIDSSIAVHQFRIIDHQKNTKYILSNGKMFLHENHKILIVTFKDITEQVKVNLELEENIDELSKSNAELESFNHIASHDLQEPLRKIQTFISVLEGKTGSEISDMQSEYLNKINLAAQRMQNLIIDLLSFSKTSIEDKVFEKSNLSDLLDNALDEVKADIQEKKAIINYDPLPIANVISFQFQQLCVNLINNALKYSKGDTIPTINIKNENVNQTDLIKYPILRGKKLVKITFEDNGIGFEQQYSEKIFNLFQRLHGKNKYYGTGIGLAICSKILQNHKGVIYAESKPDEGSKFTIIFPKEPS